MLIWAVTGALFTSLLGTKINLNKVNYFNHLILRLVVAYALFYSVYYHYWHETIPDINLIATYDTVFKDIQPNDLNRLVNKVSTGINGMEGFISLLSLIFLLNRRTAFLGFALALPMYIYIYARNLDTNCDLNGIKTLILITIGGLLPEMHNLYNYVFTDKHLKRSSHPLFNKGHLYNCLALGKYFLLAGMFVFFINKPNKYQQYYANNMDSPIKGVWTIKDVKLDMQEERDYQTDSLFHANKIYLSSSRFGKIKMNDTLSTFEYMVDPSNRQFEMWNFFDYRKLDLKGKFETLDNGTIRFIGKNGKDTVSFTMVLEDGFPIE
jgi:hypothetical protein